MKRQCISFLLALCMLFAMLPEALAASGSFGNNITWSTDSGTLVISGSGPMDDTGGAYCGPWGSSGYSYAEVRPGVTTIGGHAFYLCENLTDISIAGSVTAIGDSAFTNCKNLRSVQLPAGLTYLGTRAFMDCDSLQSVQIPGGVGTIGERAFMDCHDLARVDIAPGVTAIGERAFYNCMYLTQVSIPATVTWIGDQAFSFANDAVITYGGTRGQWESIANSIEIPDAQVRCIDDGQEPAAPEPEEKTTTVIFDANGGHVDERNRVLPRKEPLGELPVPVREGYIFDGWFDSPTGGLRMGPESLPYSVELTTLYAHWVPQSAPSVQVTLDVNSSGAYPLREPNRTLTAVPGEPYGTLIRPSWEGYSFEGWFTEPDGGDVVEEGTVVTIDRDHTLYAHWTAHFTLTLDPRGGTMPDGSGMGSWMVRNGYPYGGAPFSEFPVPTMGNTEFLGWFTEPDGGTQVRSTDIVDLTGDQTLYAHWELGSPGWPSFFLADLGYSFYNSASDFGYSDDYRIPLERYLMMYGDTERAYKVYESMSSRPWGGNCFGMSSSSAFFYTSGSGLDTGSFHSGALLAKELAPADRSAALDLTLREFIEAMQVSQSTFSIAVAFNEGYNDLDGLCQVVESYWQTKRDLPIIEVFGPTNGGQSAGHALVGYALDDAGDGTVRLLVYDCNYPETERSITLWKDASGRYTGWSYDIGTGYPTWSSDVSGCYMSYIPYSSYYDVWTNRGVNNSMMVMAYASTDSYVVDDAYGNRAVTVEDGRATSARSGIYPLPLISASEDGLAGAVEHVLWMPAELYTLTNTDSSESLFQATVVHVDQSATVSTTAAEVLFAVDDGLGLNYVRVADADSDYDMTLSSTLAEGPKDVQMSGSTGSGGAALAQFSGELYADGNGARLQSDGQEAEAGDLTEVMPQIAGMLTMPFTDILYDSWYRQGVQYVYSRGLMGGVSGERFDPTGVTSRGQIVTILYRLEGQPSAGRAPFGDVPDGQWYTDAVAWASANGIVSGYSSGAFGPNDSITREQLAAILFRYAAYKGYDTSTAADLSSFSDAGKISSYAWDALRWANGVGIMGGVSAERLSPGGTATRAEVATMLMRFCENAAR